MHHFRISHHWSCPSCPWQKMLFWCFHPISVPAGPIIFTLKSFLYLPRKLPQWKLELHLFGQCSEQEITDIINFFSFVAVNKHFSKDLKISPHPFSSCPKKNLIPPHFTLFWVLFSMLMGAYCASKLSKRHLLKCCGYFSRKCFENLALVCDLTDNTWHL